MAPAVYVTVKSGPYLFVFSLDSGSSRVFPIRAVRVDRIVGEIDYVHDVKVGTEAPSEVTGHFERRSTDFWATVADNDIRLALLRLPDTPDVHTTQRQLAFHHRTNVVVHLAHPV